MYKRQVYILTRYRITFVSYSSNIRRCIRGYRQWYDISPAKVIDVSSERELKQLQDTGSLVVINWHAQWCDPCKEILPAYEQLAKKYRNVLFCKIDINEAAQDDFQDLVVHRGIRSLPAFQASGRAVSRVAKGKQFLFVL